MNGNNIASRHSLKPDLDRVDVHQIKREKYDELPELSEDMVKRATVNKGGRPVSANHRKLISLHA